MKINIRKNIIFLLLLLFINKTVNAQSPSLIEFGQNRVQYKEFKWQFYETENFRIYFYKGGQDIGKYVILNAENIFLEMTKSLDFRLNRKIDLLVYNDISDLRQSNIGLHSQSQVENGQINFLDNKLFIYFNGSHKKLDQQIKEGITNIFIDKYVSGSGAKETFRNSVSRGIPNWYIKGLKDYNSLGWNTELENKLKDKILSGRFKNLNKLSEDEMAFVGHSLWAYVEEKYGKESVANLMYLVKVNRSINRGFRYVTGKDLASFFEEWYYYYLDRFKIERKEFDALNKEEFIGIKIKKDRVVYNVKLNSKANSIAYCTNDNGKWRVHIYNLTDSTDKVVFKGGFVTESVKTDLMNPMLSWEPRGNKLTIIYELRDRFFIRDYIIEEKKLEKETAIRKFQKIYNFSYAENSKNLIISAMQKGQIDIFKYYLPSTKITQITNDFYDDLQPAYIEIEGYKGYVFISNRNNDTLTESRIDSILPNNNFDVFFYNIEENKLAQVTFTPNTNESYPQAFDNNNFTFLSDFNGINNKYLAHLEPKKVYDKILYKFKTNENPDIIDSILLNVNEPIDSAMLHNTSLKEVVSQKLIPIYKTVGVSYAISNNNNSIQEFSTSKRKGKNIELILFKNKKRFVLTKHDLEKKDLKFGGYLQNKNARQKQIEKLEKAKKDTIKLEIENIKKESIFQSKFDDWIDSISVAEGYYGMLLPMKNSKEDEETGFKFSKTRQYFLTFKAEDLNFSLDNQIIINSYQKYKPNSPVYNNQGFSGFIKVGIVDLFENYRIHGGFRFPLDGSSIIPREFYITYENLKKRLDKEITFYRNSTKNSIRQYENTLLNNNGEEVTHLNYLQLRLKYSLDILNSVRLKMAWRNEKTVTKSTENITLNAKNVVDNWAILKLEFVHDHTIKKEENILNGFRANAYLEFQKEIPTKHSKVFNENILLPNWNDGYLFVYGADARHYQKIYKNIIWANRLAFSSSLGTRKVVYYLGNSDGTINPGFNESNAVDETQNYAFQSLAQNLRGAKQNIRNGNNYMVFNSEIRIPLVSTLSKKNTQSKFMKSLQLVGFFDLGSAWQGITPWGSDNIHTEIRTNNPLKPDFATAIVKLEVYKDPFVFSVGPGLRANLFDYYFKFDLAWVYDTGEFLKPRMQVSMTYDF